MTLATRGGEQANQERRDSNFKCPGLLVFANITPEAEMLANTPELPFVRGRTTLHAAAMNCSQAASVNLCTLLSAGTSVRLSANTGYFPLKLYQKK